MKIEANKVVTIEYTLADDQGQVIDSSAKAAPHVYLHGAHNIVPGLEDALAGLQVNDRIDVTVPPEKGYGHVDEELIHTVPRTQFPEGPIKKGMTFHARGDHGPALLRVVDVAHQEILVDANHPLAGKTLHFSVRVLAVRDATEAELAHGHVHGPGGHHHH